MPRSPLPRVLDLVHQATDLKLQRHCSDGALALLTEADALCEAHPDLPRAIHGLVAYRMGHLRMRQVTDVGTLIEAEQDFQRACRLGKGLEPWAGIYHLAVLGRLRALRPHPSIPDAIERRLEARWREVVHQQASLDPSEEPDRDDPIVQRGSLNAAEALAYTLGLSLMELEGLGSLPHDLHLEQTWGFLVGRGLESTFVRLPWGLLTPTLIQLRDNHPDALCFTLPAPGHTALLWRPGQPHPEPVSTQHAALLAWVLQGCPDGYGGLDCAVYDRHVSAPTRRKLIQRTRAWLGEAAGWPEASVLARRRAASGPGSRPDHLRRGPRRAQPPPLNPVTPRSRSLGHALLMPAHNTPPARRTAWPPSSTPCSSTAP